MPKPKLVLRTYDDERFYEPELLMRAGVQHDPKTQMGSRSRVIMEVLRANTRYFFRRFGRGEPTSTFELRLLNPGTCYQFGLRNPSSRIAYLTESEGITLTPSGERPELKFALEYVRISSCSRGVIRLTHEFAIEPWTSVRVELVAEGSEESLAITEYSCRRVRPGRRRVVECGRYTLDLILDSLYLREISRS